MEILSIILVAAAGLVFGSFLNVCAGRLPAHESVVRPRSRCPNCGAPIAAYDNIPVLSFFILGGRCRACRQTIAWRYPATEIALTALWVLCWLKFGLTLKALGMGAETFVLLGLAIMDAETLRLPDAFTLPGIVLGVVYSGAVGGRMRSSLAALGWAAAAAGVMLAISGAYWLLRRRMGLGMGDAKLMALIAAWLGGPLALLVLFLGVISAAIFGMGLSFSRRRFDGSVSLPFGAFLCAAALFATFYGRQVIGWYTAFLH